ncbi:NADP-dependent oxidoreductase domain-containing protein [Jimgerdemannia flammicorona]|uniref:NADP-dependent oxidoreductase domain-containing protein n=1 Tax=Jimgerdemannia flammicorona TaxID=994334 RepID=A0A433CYN9_9FUNG|nr:NADP-dependent oxidoreductase domain-containing protein [Jimgerdemannia flammicorona]
MDKVKAISTSISPPILPPGITIVAYSPLGHGFLTGQYKSIDDFDVTDFWRNHPRFSAENFPKNLDLIRRFEELAKAKGVASLQLVLAQGQDFIPIPGTRCLKYLEENVSAANIMLLEHELKEIRKAIDSIKIHGTRYPKAGMKILNI